MPRREPPPRAEEEVGQRDTDGFALEHLQSASVEAYRRHAQTHRQRVTRAGASAERLAISGDGGDHPVWRGDGAELFFVDPHGQLLGVAVQWSRGGSPTFGLSAKLNVPPMGRGHWGTPYDVSPDGSRIYFLRGNDDPPPHEIHVVIGWRELLG